MKSLLVPLALAGVLPVAAIAAVENPVAAENPVLEEIIVTSSRLPMPMRQVATSVSRLEREDIEDRGQFSLVDILRSLPAVGVTNSGGLGKPTALRIRGEEGFRTLVLVDGMDISDPTPPQSSPRLQHLNSTGIDSVEVLRGPQGMIYGADAGGVVSIRTHRAEPGLHSGLEVSGGRYDTGQVFTELAAGSESGEIYVSGNRLESEGFNARVDDRSADRDGYENTTFHGRMAWRPAENFDLQLVTRDVTARNEYDACYDFFFALVNDCVNHFDQRSTRLSGRYEAAGVSQTLAVQQSNLQSRDDAAGSPAFESRGSVRKIEYLGGARLDENLALVFGVDHKREEMESAGDDLSRDQLGYYLETQAGWSDRVFITAGLRRDHNDDFGRHDSYRLSGAYLLPLGDDLIKFRSSAGSGFRSPSLYEAAFNRSPWAMAPAAGLDLTEEQSRGFDLGVDYYLAGHSRVEATYFDQRVEDEIYFDPVSFSGYLQSRGSSESRGVELAVWHQSSRWWALAANATYNRSETAEGNPRIRRPKLLANASLSLFPVEDLNLQLQWRGSRRAMAVDGSPLDDYAVMDLSSRFEVGRGLVLHGRIENILNADYQEVPGYNTAGRAAYLGASLSF